MKMPALKVLLANVSSGDVACWMPRWAILSAVVLLHAASLFAGPMELGFYPAISDGSGRSSMQVFEIQEKADRVLRLDREGKFDLELGKVTDGILTPVYLTFDEIRYFLSKERHKDSVVVWFDKSIMWNEEEVVRGRTKEVIKQMQEVGYKRVVILGAHSSGVFYLADTSLRKQPK